MNVANLQRKSLDRPRQVRTFEKGKVAEIGGCCYWLRNTNLTGGGKRVNLNKNRIRMLAQSVRSFHRII